MASVHETNPYNGQVRDKTHPDIPCSIAAVGMALATIPVVVERGVVIRKFAAKIARRQLRNLLDLTARAGARYRRVQGILLRQRHRVRDCEVLAEVRRLSDELYHRAEW